MKKIILFIIIVGILQYAQSGPYNLYTSTTVYTCKNGTVAAGVLNANSDLSTYQKSAAIAALLDPNNSEFGYLGIQASDILDGATYSYNCHAYAWHLTEGKTNRVWINNTYGNQDSNGCYISNHNLDIYWSSTYGCFVECTESEAEKIHYYCGDHSAVKSSVSSKYESKWGDYPLVRHTPTQVPYTNPGSRRYYKRIPPPPVISGPNFICPGSTTYTFTATNWQAWYSWNKSYNLEIATVNANTITVYGTNYYGEGSSGWVNILQLNGAEVAKHNLWVGAPEIQIYGPSSIGQSGEAQFYCESTSDLVNAYQLYYEWAVYPDIGFYGYGYGPQVSIQFPSYYSNYTVSVRASNDCGWGDYVSHDVGLWRSPAPSSVYPNPVSDIVSIEIDAQAQSSAPTITSGTQLKLDKTYDLRLYDGQGNILRNAKTKGGTVQFNVSALPNGIYYLHIYDGVNPKPEIQQIVVEH